MKKTGLLLLALMALTSLPASLYAESTPSAKGGQSFMYVEPSLENLSKLYWALSRLDVNNDDHIDNFMMINECDVYRDYFHHDFQWKEVRNSARKHILESKDSYPLRFKFVQPLRLGNYDFEKKQFELVPDYQINGIRRFEIISDDWRRSICGEEGRIEDYPRGLIVELSRPLELKTFPLSPVKADEYITEKLEKFREYSESKQTEDRLYQSRDAYLVMKVKFFASDGFSRADRGALLANGLAVLEKIEIYADRGLTDLLYEESFRRQKIRSPEQQKYIDMYKQKQEAQTSAE